MATHNYSRRNSRTGRRHRTEPLAFTDTRCVLYIRASTADQKNSLDAQAHEAARFATSHGKTIVETFIDPGVSGSKPFLQRKEARKAVAYMKREGITTLLVLKLDRAFRNTVDMHTTIDHLMAEGISFRIANPDIDFTGPFGRLIATLLGAIAEFELGCRAERQKDGIEVMRRKQVSRSQYAPFGWELGEEIPDEKSHAGRPLRRLVPNEREQETLREIITLYERNQTLQSIADRLNSDNIPTKRAGSTITRHGKTIICSGKWHPATVKSVLDDAETV
jgi:DNA invertase Pin-like site-specific DNA recombinase